MNGKGCFQFAAFAAAVLLCGAFPALALRPSTGSENTGLEEDLRARLGPPSPSPGLEETEAQFIRGMGAEVSARYGATIVRLAEGLRDAAYTSDWKGWMNAVEQSAQELERRGFGFREFADGRGSRWARDPRWLLYEQTLRFNGRAFLQKLHRIAVSLATYQQLGRLNREASSTLIETSMTLLASLVTTVRQPSQMAQIPPVTSPLTSEEWGRLLRLQDEEWKFFGPLGEVPLPAVISFASGIFVPSPGQVTAELMKEAGIHETSFVYDAGAGAGNALVVAGVVFNARGFGREMVPELAEIAQRWIAHLESPQVGLLLPGQIRVEQGDAFSVSPQGFTHLYSFPAGNDAYRSAFDRWIFRETPRMIPGTRLVLLPEDIMLKNSLGQLFPAIVSSGAWQILKNDPKGVILERRRVGLEEDTEREGIPIVTSVPMGALADDLDDWFQENWEAERPTQHYGEARISLRVTEKNRDYALVMALGEKEWVREHPELKQELPRNLGWMPFEELLGYGLVQVPVGRYRFSDGREIVVIERVHILPGTLQLDHREEVEIRREIIESIGEWGLAAGVPVYLVPPKAIQEAIHGLKDSTVYRHYIKPVNRRLWKSNKDTRLILRGSTLTPEEPFRFRLYRGAGLEEVTVEAEHATNPVEAEAIAMQLVELRYKNPPRYGAGYTGNRRRSKIVEAIDRKKRILLGQTPGIVVAAWGSQALYGYGEVELPSPSEMAPISINEIIVAPDREREGIATRILQELMWQLGSFTDNGKVKFLDLSDRQVSGLASRGISALIGHRFFFELSDEVFSEFGDIFVKDIQHPPVYFDQMEQFLDAISMQEFLARYSNRLDLEETQRIRDFFSGGKANARVARIDLTRIPIYVQGRSLYGLVQKHLRPMYPGILFYPVLVPEPGSADWEKFRWGNFGVVLKDATLPEIPNRPEYLRQIEVNPTEQAVASLDPRKLLALIYRNVLDIPVDAQDVQAILFSDAQGYARLILLYQEA